MPDTPPPKPVALSAIFARATYHPRLPKVPLRSALGCALLRFQRMLLAIFARIVPSLLSTMVTYDIQHADM